MTEPTEAEKAAAKKILDSTWDNPEWSDAYARDGEHTADPRAGEAGSQQSAANAGHSHRHR